VLLAASLMAVLLPLAASSSSADPAQTADADVIPGRYIVGFRKAVDSPAALSNNLENAEGFQTQLRYRHALEGFSARLTSKQVKRLRRHPKVDFVVPDREVQAVGTVDLVTGDTAPTGVRRFDAATTTHTLEASSKNVAVIDTGIDLDHPDLNAVNGKDCTGSEPAQDDNGHGTHVAGTIAAKNDGGGVVGVAPGTKVYAVKVLTSSGSGSWSQVICGIDWVTGTRTDRDSNGNLITSNDISVANMSLGGGGSALKTCATTSDALHLALCRSTAAGVNHVVAAGNDGWDFDYASSPDVPAAYPEVLTVTAVSDSDGSSGGTGGNPTCRSGEVDDRYASFSNYAATAAGQEHTIAAPGVCIKSDWPGSGTTYTTNTISGTSMATPHIAGLVALCLERPAAEVGGCGGLSPAGVIQEVRQEAAAYNTSNRDYGFNGDPDQPVSGEYYGWLARVGMAPAGPPPPGVTDVSPDDGATGVALEATVSVTFSQTMNQASAQGAFTLKPSAGGAALPGTFSWSGNTMTFDPTDSLAQGTSYTATVAATAENATGQQLGTGYTWSFQTLDGDPPGVTDVSPDQGAVEVSPATTVSVTFDEAMNQAATQNAFSLDGGVGGSFSWSGNTMTFDPSANLAGGTTHTARVTTAAMDASGNPLAANEEWQFTTAPVLYDEAAAPWVTVIETGSLRSGTSARLAADDGSYYEVSSTGSGTRIASWYGSFASVPNDLSSLVVTYRGRSSQSSTGQTVDIWNWANEQWDQLDSRTVSTSEILIEKSPTGQPTADYVSETSGLGELRVRVHATRSSGSFYTRGDLMKIAFQTPTVLPESVSAAPSGSMIEVGSPRSGSYTSLATDNSSYYEVTSTSSDTRTAQWYGSFTGVSNDLSDLKVTYSGRNSSTCTQTLSIYNYAVNDWSALDTRSVGTTEVLIEKIPAVGPGFDYVSDLGELRVQVKCTSGSSFYTRGDLMTIAYFRP
jgi:subtilisin